MFHLRLSKCLAAIGAIICASTAMSASITLRSYTEDFSNDLHSLEPDTPHGAATNFAALSTPGATVKGYGIKVLHRRLFSLGRHTDFWAGIISNYLAFEFDANELGWYPQSVSLVTSSAIPLTFTVYGPNDSLVETRQVPASLPPSPQLWGLGATLSYNRQDRFFGMVSPHGISRFEVSTSAGSLFIDDFQYGLLIPEPSTLVIALIALFTIGWRVGMNQTKPAAWANPFAGGGW
jgi:hypothetical protein